MSKKRFLDRLRLYVKGGTGGAGFPKFGGKGGNGGNVSFSARQRYRLASVLKTYPDKRVIAHPGKPATRFSCLGRPGHDVNVVVPTGVELRLDDGTFLGELNKDGDRVIVAQGGIGGGPMNGYSPTRGEARSVTMDLKLIADVGLVGFPNAGKSTLLGAVSRTSPKVAEYPFTTIMPMIATMDYQDGRQITVADLPGLIEGAHINVGLGHHFLKHVERTKCLLFVLDVTGFQFKSQTPFRSVEETALLLNRELELYKAPLIEKPALCVVNKRDLVAYDPGIMEHVMENLRDLPAFVEACEEELGEQVRPKQVMKFNEVIEVSAKNRDNTEHLKERLRYWLDEFESQRQKETLQDAEEKLVEQLRRSSLETFKSIV